MRKPLSKMQAEMVKMAYEKRALVVAELEKQYQDRLRLVADECGVGATEPFTIQDDNIAVSGIAITWGEEPAQAVGGALPPAVDVDVPKLTLLPSESHPADEPVGASV